MLFFFSLGLVAWSRDRCIIQILSRQKSLHIFSEDEKYEIKYYTICNFMRRAEYSDDVVYFYIIILIVFFKGNYK